MCKPSEARQVPSNFFSICFSFTVGEGRNCFDKFCGAFGEKLDHLLSKFGSIFYWSSACVCHDVGSYGSDCDRESGGRCLSPPRLSDSIGLMVCQVFTICLRFVVGLRVDICATLV